MRLLIVSALPAERAQAAVETLRARVPDCRVIDTTAMHLSPCVGCNACWLKTPGICSIHDGYDQLLKGYLESDAVVFLSGTALNFVDHRMKNIIDRLLPLATMYVRIKDGQCRHRPRYHKNFRFGLLYDGAADQNYLNEWMECVMVNFDGESLGAFPITQAEEVLPCIS